MRELAPDVLALAAFGQIIPQALLDIPPLGPINVHGSLLPKYRGAAPIQRAIMAGETETGVTTMWMEAALDTGDMLLAASLPIRPRRHQWNTFPAAGGTRCGPAGGNAGRAGETEPCRAARKTIRRPRLPR